MRAVICAASSTCRACCSANEARRTFSRSRSSRSSTSFSSGAAVGRGHRHNNAAMAMRIATPDTAHGIGDGCCCANSATASSTSVPAAAAAAAAAAADSAAARNAAFASKPLPASHADAKVSHEVTSAASVHCVTQRASLKRASAARRPMQDQADECAARACNCAGAPRAASRDAGVTRAASEVARAAHRCSSCAQGRSLKNVQNSSATRPTRSSTR